MNRSDNVLNNAILVCGCGRSGTSIIGRFIASHQGVEYSFDPPTIHRLIYCADTLDSNIWKQLVSVYLYRDVFINSIAGRNLNLNKRDLSFIYSYKDEGDIERRFNQPFKWSTLEKREGRHTLCFKVTDAILRVKFFNEAFPNMRIVVMCRNARDTISSIVRQGWFAEESLLAFQGCGTLPTRPYKGRQVPLWVEDMEIGDWIGFSEVERAASYFVKTNDALLAQCSHAIVLNYDWLLAHSAECLQRLRKYLDLKPGKKTTQVEASVSRVPRTATDILDRCRPEIRNEVVRVDSGIKRITLTVS